MHNLMGNITEYIFIRLVEKKQLKAVKSLKIQLSELEKARSNMASKSVNPHTYFAIAIQLNLLLVMEYIFINQNAA